MNHKHQKGNIFFASNPPQYKCTMCGLMFFEETTTNPSTDWEKQIEEAYAYSNTYPAVEYPDQADESGRDKGYVRDLKEMTDLVATLLSRKEEEVRREVAEIITKDIQSLPMKEAGIKGKYYNYGLADALNVMRSYLLREEIMNK